MDIEWKIIKKVAGGTASEEEKREAERWADGSPERRRFLDDSIRYYSEDITGDELLSDAAIAAAWRSADPRPRRVNARRRTWWVAASVAVALAAGAGLMLTDRGTDRLAAAMPEQSVQLTLPDGSVYNIKAGSSQEIEIPGFVVTEDGSLSQSEETRAGDDAEPLPAYVEINVPRGNSYSITIADGTRVKLNAESSLRFLSSFAGPERSVELRGEAYFEVASDPAKPFIVHTGDATVRVLGTDFNVRAYSTEGSSVALVSGSVEVDTDSGHCLLRPGEQCDIDSGSGSLAVTEADMPAVLAWKDDEFVFRDATLLSITNELTRWYDVEVVYEQPHIQEERFYVFVGRGQSLTEVLDKIAMTERVSYKIKKGKVIISE